jgi:Bifunctional DNA primase/polymerase, N-terminal
MPHPREQHGRSHQAVELALELASVGWHVLPLSPASKKPLGNCPRCRDGTRCATGAIDNCPCLPAGNWCHGVRAATTDPARITSWWHAQPNAIPGIAAGPSSLVLIDLDNHGDPLPPNLATGLLPGIDLTAEDLPDHLWRDTSPTGSPIHNGRDTMRLLAHARGGQRPWPAAAEYRPVSVATPSGGRHLWYQAPADGLRQALSGLGWQIDIKAGWNYGIAPGAVARTGPYKVLAGDVTRPGRMPDWLAQEVIRVATTNRRRSQGPLAQLTTAGLHGDHVQGRAAYLRVIITRGSTELAALTDGRQRALSALAYKVGGLLAWADLPQLSVESQLVDAGIASGLPNRLARRIVHRALTNGIHTPLPGPKPRKTSYAG